MSEQLPSDLRVGDVAVWQNCTVNLWHNGVETTVIKGPGMLGYTDYDGTHRTEYGYHVQDSDGSIWFARPSNLRKKRPPREDLQLVRWDECPWQPENVNV